jgi:peptide/nickel transport system permease protein
MTNEPVNQRTISVPAKIGLVFVFLLTLISIMGSIIRPDYSQYANDQQLVLALNGPGFEVKSIEYKLETSESIWEIWRNGGATISKKWVPIESYRETEDSLFCTVYNSGGEVINESKIKLDQFDGASYVRQRKFYLGTDKYGRDVLSRLMSGISTSLLVGLISVFISLIVGVPLGLLAGYFRGKVDLFIQYAVQVIWSIPTLLFVMAICVALGNHIWVVFVGVGLTMWVEVARVTRGQVLSIREKEFVAAAQIAGISDFRILFFHILPNASAPIIVMSASNFAAAILIEAGLSFLGLGIQMPQASWGNMIRESYAYITTDMAYLAIIPGVCIMLLVLSFMIIGNSLRDKFDVKSS